MPFKYEKRFPLWLFIVVVSLMSTGLGFLLGAYVHPVLLLVFSSVPFYPIYLSQFKARQHGRAVLYVAVWAVTNTFMMILLTLGYASHAAKAVIAGSSYQEEMFVWLATGVGPEGDPSLFVPDHLTNAAVFSTLSLATGGFLALLFGAYQMNYMNFYVGILFSRVFNPTPYNLILVASLSWPIYAILRVVGFICIGVATTIPLASKMFNETIESRPLVRFLLTGIILVVTDILLKALVSPFYRELLTQLVRTP